jgi:mRNA-degrading endonuclease RelE of RelBE toxin-antitoxin system
MPKVVPFEIVFDEQVSEHFSLIERKYDALIREALETQLRFEPYRPTRQRKPLKYPTALGATWELRCGPYNRFRIFYDIDLEARRVVILAIAVKIRAELWIGKERLNP